MSGVFGVFSSEEKSVMDTLFYGLTALQHRGEQASGMAIPGRTSSQRKILIKKGAGPIYDFFKDEVEFLQAINPHMGIGHALYEATGNIQPTHGQSAHYELALAMDGIILGFREKHDIVVRDLLLGALEKHRDIYQAAGELMEELADRGSHNLVVLIRQGDGFKLVAMRDPKGIKPLCLGRKEGKYIVASESKGLDGVEAELIRDIEPGEVVVLSKAGLESKQVKASDHAHCAFEWVYFADPTSVIEGRNVYLVRKALGRHLAEKYPLDVDVVIASPDSGRGVSLGFAQARGIPFEEAVVKNPGAKRTFQVEDPEERKMAARAKFFIIKEMIAGRKVALGDDSIVRGTVIRDGMIYKLRSSGAREVHVLISCPALCYPCFKDPASKVYAAYGMHHMPVEEIGRKVAANLGADSVCYPSVEALEEAIGHPGLCRACMDGQYPVARRFLEGQARTQAAAGDSGG